MKINFIVSGIFKSGGMKIIFEYGNRLTDRGHDVVLYYPSVSYNFYNGEPELNLNPKKIYSALNNFLQRGVYKKLNYNCKFNIKQIPLINDFFVRDADSTIATIWHTSYSVYKLSKSKGKKIYFIQDYEIWNADRELVDNSYKLQMTRITISSFLNKLLMEKFNSESEIIYNGIDFNFFYNSDKNFNKKKKSIVFIDYKLEKKNVEICIEVLKNIKEKFNSTDIICFGLEKFHTLPDYIKFFENPSENKIKEIYSEGDIFLFTSKSEGFGLPPAEAMACKCAVVTSPVGAIPEFSKNGESAIFIDPNDISEIVNAVSGLIENEANLQLISENGFKSVTSTLDWDISYKKFENILKNT